LSIRDKEEDIMVNKSLVKLLKCLKVRFLLSVNEDFEKINIPNVRVLFSKMKFYKEISLRSK
jgi:hypothetical protein